MQMISLALIADAPARITIYEYFWTAESS